MSYLIKVKNEIGERRLISQESKVNFTLFDYLAKGFSKQQNLLNLHLVHQQISTKTWGNLGDGIANNTTL